MPGLIDQDNRARDVEVEAKLPPPRARTATVEEGRDGKTTIKLGPG